jgi:hypothetical protein
MHITRTPSRMESDGPFKIVQWEDFGGLNISSTTGLADWQFTESAAGATELLSATISGGVLVLTDTNTEDQLVDISANAGVRVDACKPGSPIKFQARFKTDDADQMDIHIGLNIKDASMVAGAAADYVMFRSQDASAALDLVISKDSATTEVLNFITLADDTWCHVEFEFLPDATTPDLGAVKYRAITNGTVDRFPPLATSPTTWFCSWTFKPSWARRRLTPPPSTTWASNTRFPRWLPRLAKENPPP